MMMKLNIPNQLIILRLFLTLIVVILLALVPWSLNNDVFLFEINGVKISWLNVIAAFVFLLAAFTDWLDGYLARKYNQVTNFGKLFDPLADKILVNTILVFFAIYFYIPIFLIVLFIGRDLMVDGLRLNLAKNGKVLAANSYGKLKTFFQIIGITILFVFHPEPAGSDFLYFDYNSIGHLFLIPIYIALFFSLYSGFKYYKDNFKYII